MLSLILFIVILGTIVLIHELGHFLFAKLFGVYVYEYSIGMGKKLFSKRPKNSETEYNIRMFPIGGFVRLAGEEGEDGDDAIPLNRKLYKKSFWQRFLVFFMGPGFNMLLAFVTLFVCALMFGGSLATVELEGVKGAAYQSGIRDGDTLLEVAGEKVSTWNDVSIKIGTLKGATIDFKVKRQSGDVEVISVTPLEEENTACEEDDKEECPPNYVYGVGSKIIKKSGFVGSLEYAFIETGNILLSMGKTLKYLFTGKLGINDLSGPVGIYSFVDEQAEHGIANLLYLLAYLSVNVGVINLIPFPAFDGGHILFLLIEKVRGKPVSAKVESTITGIGFILLILLMIYVTCHDVINLF